MLKLRNNRKEDSDEEMSWWESITANVWASMATGIIIVLAVVLIVALVLPTQDLVAAAQADLIADVMTIVGVGVAVGLAVYIVSYQHRIYATVKLINRRLRDGPQQDTLDFISLDDEEPETQVTPGPGVIEPATVEQPLVAGTPLEETAADGYAPLSLEGDELSQDSQILQQLLSGLLEEDDNLSDSLGNTQEIIISPDAGKIISSGILTVEQQTAHTQEFDVKGVREAMHQQRQEGTALSQIPEETEDGDSLLFLGKGVAGLEDAELEPTIEVEITDALDGQDSEEEAVAELETTQPETESANTSEDVSEEPIDSAETSHHTTVVNIMDHLGDEAAREAEIAEAREKRIELEAKELGVSPKFLHNILVMGRAVSYYDLPHYWRDMVDNQRRRRQPRQSEESIQKQA